MLCHNQPKIVPIVNGLYKNRLIDAWQFIGGGAKIGAASLFAIPTQGAIICAVVARCFRMEEATDTALPLTDEPEKRAVMKAGKWP